MVQIRDVDAEVLAVPKCAVLAEWTDEIAAGQALIEFRRGRIRRSPSGPLLTRAFELHRTVATGDALYVALAVRLECPLVTTDARLARSHGHVA